jgi:hypothetical protein
LRVGCDDDSWRDFCGAPDSCAAVADTVVTRLKKLPPPTSDYTVARNVRVPMREEPWFEGRFATIGSSSLLEGLTKIRRTLMPRLPGREPGGDEAGDLRLDTSRDLAGLELVFPAPNRVDVAVAQLDCSLAAHPLLGHDGPLLLGTPIAPTEGLVRRAAVPAINLDARAPADPGRTHPGDPAVV